MLLELNLDGMQLISAKNVIDTLTIFMGTVLAPWPNRLRDGRYELAGEQFEFAELDDQNNLNHGLSSKVDFKVLKHQGNQLVLGHRFGSDMGYPFDVELEVTYRLGSDSLEVTAVAQNNELEPVPFALGFHPYFLAGDDLELSGDFTGHILTDERMLPSGSEKVSGLKFTGGQIDDCFFGAPTATLQSSVGRVELELGENMNYFMFYRPGHEVGESLLAIEPMSDPANVFTDDIESVLIPPGDKKVFSFAIRKR
jgi:aldose 1-epimerase